LFSCSPEGAHASAAIYSLIETAKANGLDPYWYLKHLFKHVPEAMTMENFEALLPHNVDKSMLAAIDISFYRIEQMRFKMRLRNRQTPGPDSKLCEAFG
jgi:hypothetical protein